MSVASNDCFSCLWARKYINLEGNLWGECGAPLPVFLESDVDNLKKRHAFLGVIQANNPYKNCDAWRAIYD